MSSAAEFVIATDVERMKLVPADRQLTGAEIEMVPLPQREERLRTLLASSRDDFDYIFIDCPPSLGLLTLNALVAADAVLIPLHCEYFALEGLADLVGTMRRVRAALNPALDIEGVLLTMCDERTNLGQQVARDVREFFKEKVFRTVIPRNVRLGEAPSHGMPVMLYDVKSRGAEAYLALAREVLERRGARVTTAGTMRTRRCHRERRRSATQMDSWTNAPRSAKASARSSPTRPSRVRASTIDVDIDRLRRTISSRARRSTMTG